MPKSTIYTLLASLVPGRPSKKLSGLISRYIRFFSWMVCTRVTYDKQDEQVMHFGFNLGGDRQLSQLTISFASIATVFTENIRPHLSNTSSKLGPSRSITNILCMPS